MLFLHTWFELFKDKFKLIGREKKSNIFWKILSKFLKLKMKIVIMVTRKLVVPSIF